MWMLAGAFLAVHWRLPQRIPSNTYSLCATIALAVFLVSFLYALIGIRCAFGPPWSSSAPTHDRWKNYCPNAILVLSVSSFVFYWFACFAYYGQMGVIVFPGFALICFGGSCALSYL